MRSRWSNGWIALALVAGCGGASPRASEPASTETREAAPATSSDAPASEGEVATTDPEQPLPEASPPPPPATPCESPSTACEIRDEVRALAAQGTPTTVVREVTTTFGWGCRCPDYVDARTPDEASYPEQYVLVDASSPSPPPAQPEYLGRFRLTGHYSGEWALGPRGEGAGETLHPTFVVESWCYEGPLRRVPRELREFNRTQSELPRCER